MPVVHTLHHADDGDAQWLRALLRRERDDISEADVARAIGLFRASGAVDAAFAEIDRRAELATTSPAIGAYAALRDLVAGMSEVFLAPIEGMRAELTSDESTA